MECASCKDKDKALRKLEIRVQSLEKQIRKTKKLERKLKAKVEAEMMTDVFEDELIEIKEEIQKIDDIKEEETGKNLLKKLKSQILNGEVSKGKEDEKIIVAGKEFRASPKLKFR